MGVQGGEWQRGRSRGGVAEGRRQWPEGGAESPCRITRHGAGEGPQQDELAVHLGQEQQECNGGAREHQQKPARRFVMTMDGGRRQPRGRGEGVIHHSLWNKNPQNHHWAGPEGLALEELELTS